MFSFYYFISQQGVFSDCVMLGLIDVCGFSLSYLYSIIRYCKPLFDVYMIQEVDKLTTNCFVSGYNPRYRL